MTKDGKGLNKSDVIYDSPLSVITSWSSSTGSTRDLEATKSSSSLAFSTSFSSLAPLLSRQEVWNSALMAIATTSSKLSTEYLQLV